MEVQAKVTVRGAKVFKGNIDGQQLDSGKIFTDIDLKGETSWGMCTQEMKCENSAIVEAIKHNPFPFDAELTIQMESNGKVTSQLVKRIVPLQRSVNQQAAPVQRPQA
jgi:hypothetical protein